MKLKTYIFLKHYIKKHIYGQDGDYTLFNLFKLYADKEVKTYRDIVSCGKEFMNFVKKNKDKIQTEALKYDYCDFEDDLIDIDYAINGLIQESRVDEVNSFVDFVDYFTHNGEHILDVGAGAVPMSSIKLAAHNRDVSAMDKLMLSDELLASTFGVAAKDELFTTQTDVSSYDYLVGNRPCGAIGDIVEVANRENKAYILNLCHCEAAGYAKKKGMKGDNWFEILPEIDSKIKFADHVATNLDISDEKLSEVQERYFGDFAIAQNTMLQLAKLMMTGMEQLTRGFQGEKTIKTEDGTTIVCSKVCIDGEWKRESDETDEPELGEEE